MDASSRMPDGWPNVCPACGHQVQITPSSGSMDALCPHCEQLLWFMGPILMAPLFDVESTRVDATAARIPDDFYFDPGLLETIPGSVARENHLFPLAESADGLIVAMEPGDLDSVEKIRFILNREVFVVLTDRQWIDVQIEKYYAVDDQI